MVSDIRKERLSTLYGMQSTLCLQVFAVINQRGHSEDKFNQLVRQHQIEVNTGTGSGYFDPNFDPFEFGYEGMVRKKKDGSHYFHDFALQSVFTTLNTRLVKKVSNDSEALNQSHDVVYHVAQSYKDALEDAIPDIEFKTPKWARTKNLTVKFYFSLQPYDFDLHPPYDMDVLKPITIIDGHIIEPSKPESLDLTLV